MRTMSKKQPKPSGSQIPGRAVDDEDPDHSPMDGLAKQIGPAQPYDVEKVEEDRAKSTGSDEAAPTPKSPRKGRKPDR
jgi:hypothetical protein